MSPAEPPAGGREPERFDPVALAELPPELALSRLPVGRHGLPRSFVALNQRLRILAAMLRLLPQRGYPAITIADLTSQAGVSRAAFYEHFDGKQECFLATYDTASQWLRERVERAIPERIDWPAGVLAGVSEALRLLAANPPIAHLFAVDALQAGSAARLRHQATLAGIAAALRGGRPDGGDLPAELEELQLGGLITLVGRYVDGGRVEQLPEATPELVEYLLLPHLEPAETRRIAARAA